MKFLSKTIGIFVILFSFTAIFTACKSSSDDDPEAQVPRITSISADVTTVVNIAKELTVGVEVSDSGKLSYQWYVSDSKLSKGAPEENGNAASFSPKTTNAGIFYYYCEIKNTLDSSVRSAISPIITYKVTDCINAQAPALVQQPENVTASFGESFSLSTFSYSTDGGTLSYQWFYAADKDKDATSIPEATKAAYTGAISAGSLGYYYCVITNTIPDNGDGGEKTASITTETVKLSSTQIFAKTPVILQQPQNLTLDFGNDFTFSVAAYSADGGNLSYQWYYKASENDEAAAINDATTQTYTGTVSAKTIGYYYCLIENIISDNGDGGTKTATLQTNAVILSNDTIEANKPVILTQPQGATLHVPEKTLLSVSAYSVDKGKLTYQWHKITGETDEAIENAKESSYEVIANKVGTTKYYCTVTNTIPDNGDGGLKSAAKETDTITITVEYTNANEPVITTQPEDVSAVIPAVKVFQIGAYTEDDGVLTYQWYSVAEGETEGTPITGENKSKLIVNVKELGKTGYYCVVTNTIPDNGDGSRKKQASVKSETAWLDAIYLKEVISAPVFIEQPAKLNIAPYNQSIKLTCNANAAEGTVSYRWYESTDGTTDKGVAVSNATTSTLTTPKYTERGIYYYYCVATNVLAESEENIKSACAISDVISVAYTGLPLVRIETADGLNPTGEKEKHNGRMILIRNGEHIYDSGSENKFSIKVRGNATAGYPKKPYKLKLPEKANLLDKTAPLSSSENKDKNWVLLAGYCDKTLLRTKTGFFTASLFNELAENEPLYVPHSEFVDVVLNGEYIGNYVLSDSVKEGDNRVKVNEKETKNGGIGFVAEYDSTYYVNEPKWFKSAIKQYPYTFKFPDTDDENFDSYMSDFETYINAFEDALYNSESNDDWKEYIDIGSFARWFLSHNILGNKDTNFFFSKKNSVTDNSSENKSKLVMGPVWDFEWSIGIGWYYGSRPMPADFWCVNHWYFKELLTKEEFKSEVKNQWQKLIEAYPNLTETINNQMDTWANEIDISQQMNFKRWDVLNTSVSIGGIPLGSYEAELECDKQFILNRIEWLNAAINKL